MPKKTFRLAATVSSDSPAAVRAPLERALGPVSSAREPLKFGVDSSPPSCERLGERLRSCGLSLGEQRTLGRKAGGPGAALRRRSWLSMKLIFKATTGHTNVVVVLVPGYAAYRERTRYRLIPHAW